MNLIIDQGNTRDKVGLFHEGRLIRKSVFEKIGLHQVNDFLQDEQVLQCIVSSVSTADLPQKLRSRFSFTVYELSASKPLPFTIKYETPETLGLDRLALAAAAVATYPVQDCLVIDAGTSLTYDFVDRAGAYLGGAIAPGLQMRYRALHEFTARLPLVPHQKPDVIIGRSTVECIRSGVANGMLHEVKGTIQAYEERFPQMLTIITGGDAPLFDDVVKNSIFAAPDFLLHGLNNILDYYAKTF